MLPPLTAPGLQPLDSAVLKIAAVCNCVISSVENLLYPLLVVTIALERNEDKQSGMRTTVNAFDSVYLYRKQMNNTNHHQS